MKTEHKMAKRILGLYVLGGLSEDEGRFVLGHVRRCAACRAELEELFRLAQALPQVKVPTEPPPGLRDTVMSKVTRVKQAFSQDRLRIRRWWVVPVLESVVFVVAVWLVSAVLSWGADTPVTALHQFLPAATTGAVFGLLGLTAAMLYPRRTTRRPTA
ncbi:MAG: zf-HC2 domain-containing protein [Bacillota bacterium]